jgi:hypothetical protein
MIMHSVKLSRTNKLHENLWWMRWCLNIYSESVLEILRPTHCNKK